MPSPALQPDPSDRAIIDQAILNLSARCIRFTVVDTAGHMDMHCLMDLLEACLIRSADIAITHEVFDPDQLDTLIDELETALDDPRPQSLPVCNDAVNLAAKDPSLALYVATDSMPDLVSLVSNDLSGCPDTDCQVRDIWHTVAGTARPWFQHFLNNESVPRDVIVDLLDTVRTHCAGLYLASGRRLRTH
jgi:hypothetical protein